MSEDEVTGTQTAEAEKPKVRRTRKTTAKPKAAEAAGDAASTYAAPANAPAQEAGAEGEKKAPAKRKYTRRTTAKTASAPKPAESAAEATAQAPAADAPAEAPAPAKRTPRTRKKAVEEPGRALTEDEAAALIAEGRARMAAEAAAKAKAEEKAAAAPTEQAASADESGEKPARAQKASSSAPYPRRRRAHIEPVDEHEGEGEGGRRRRPRRSVKAEGGAAIHSTQDEAPAKASQNEEATESRAESRNDARSESHAESRAQSHGNNQGHGQNQGGKQNGSRDRNNHNERTQGKQNNRNDRNNNRNDRNNRNNRRNREVEPSVTREELAELKVAELREKASELELDFAGMKKAELVEAVYEATVKAEGFMEVSGVLDILSDGYGFVRTQGYLPSESDCYVGLSLIKRNGLRKGDYLVGQTRPARSNEKYAAIQKIDTVNGVPLAQLGKRPRFADLTPVYPSERLWMEHGKNTITSRVIDLVAPIGKGQRGLIVSPPKAGKTTILKDIAASISANNPEVHLMCLLIDERPEEVTDMQRSIKGEVISSTFDMPADNHIACAEMVIERAKRLVETGQDVVILLDSITRLARAYNLAQPASGRVLSGGVDSTALYPPKKFLGAARNIENGGSLTILASALIDTGSKMDEVIFEEFKGTGNMELKLDRNLADRRIFPAIDPVSSGTRKEELLIYPQLAPLIWAVRRILANMNNTERATDTLIKSIKQTETNQEFLLRTARKAQYNAKADSFVF